MKGSTCRGMTLVEVMIVMALSAVFFALLGNIVAYYAQTTKLVVDRGQRNDLGRMLVNQIDCARTVANHQATCDAGGVVDLVTSECEVLRHGEYLVELGRQFKLSATCNALSAGVYELDVSAQHIQGQGEFNPLVTPIVCRVESGSVDVGEACKTANNGECEVSFKLSDYISDTSGGWKLHANHFNGHIPGDCGPMTGGGWSCSCDGIPGGTDFEFEGGIANSGQDLRTGNGRVVALDFDYDAASETVTLRSRASGWGGCAGNPCNACISDIEVSSTESLICPGI